MFGIGGASGSARKEIGAPPVNGSLISNEGISNGGTSMKRRILSTFLSSLLLAAAAAAAPLTAGQREATIRFVNTLQNPDGGFRSAAPEGKSALGNGVPAARAARYLGGKLEHPGRAGRFVLGCYDPATGSFHDAGEAASVRSTAMGLMSVTELRLPFTEEAPKVVRYFEQNAKSVPDLYIAEAALEPAHLRPANPRPWLEAFEATRNADGSYGKSAPDTARAVVTYLRLRAELPDCTGALKALRAAQNADGGFSAGGSSSDLAATYPVMRAFSMLKEKPDLARVRGFVERCRNADGGYGVTPGAASTVSGTYYAAVIQHWADELEK